MNILSQANPLYVAKQAGTLDFVSNGLFEWGIGIGWLREEFQAGRGARFDDYTKTMRTVWSGEAVEHRSEFLNWTGFKSPPRADSDMGVSRFVVMLPALGKGNPVENLKAFSENVTSKVG